MRDWQRLLPHNLYIDKTSWVDNDEAERMLKSKDYLQKGECPHYRLRWHKENCVKRIVEKRFFIDPWSKKKYVYSERDYTKCPECEVGRKILRDYIKTGKQLPTNERRAFIANRVNRGQSGRKPISFAQFLDKFKVDSEKQLFEKLTSEYSSTQASKLLDGISSKTLCQRAIQHGLKFTGRKA